MAKIYKFYYRCVPCNIKTELIILKTSESTCSRKILSLNSVLIRSVLAQFTKNCYVINPYPTAFPYGNGMVLHFYQQQESSTTKTVHKVINKGLKTYV